MNIRRHGMVSVGICLPLVLLLRSSLLDAQQPAGDAAISSRPDISDALPVVDRARRTNRQCVVWPYFASSSGDMSIRGCGWWKSGWPAFTEKLALPACERYGRVWIHNPGGVVIGEPMKFSQFSDCRLAAQIGGNQRLRLIADWDEFSRQMSRITRAGHELVIYIGSPSTMRPRHESRNVWLQQAIDELEPVLRITPKAIIGFDATYGHPADPTKETWKLLGGPEGHIAALVEHLQQRGHEVLFEPCILYNAEWARRSVGVTCTEWAFKRGISTGETHHIPRWGRWARPEEILGRFARILPLEKGTKQERQQEIQRVLAQGFDVVAPVMGLPDYPFR